MHQFTDDSLLSHLIFPIKLIRCRFLLSTLVLLSQPLYSSEFISSLQSFFFSRTAPSKKIFSLPPRKFILPCYLIILCNSMPNPLSFSQWNYVLKKTKRSVLVLTYCRLSGNENATVLVLRKIPLNSGLCACKAEKQTSHGEHHLTPASLLSG